MNEYSAPAIYISLGIVALLGFIGSIRGCEQEHQRLRYECIMAGYDSQACR